MNADIEDDDALTLHIRNFLKAGSGFVNLFKLAIVKAMVIIQAPINRRQHSAIIHEDPHSPPPKTQNDHHTRHHLSHPFDRPPFLEIFALEVPNPRVLQV